MGLGMVPLDSGRNSVQFAHANASAALIWSQIWSPTILGISTSSAWARHILFTFIPYYFNTIFIFWGPGPGPGPQYVKQLGKYQEMNVKIM